MITLLKPENEDARLSALRKLALLDSASEARFNRITALAARAFDVPIAQINLIDEDRQWTKSAFGSDMKEADRADSFCAHTILGGETLVVTDATRDARFTDNPFVVSDPKVRFYAGCPLSHGGDGLMIGTLCLVDRRPRLFRPEDEALLRDLGEMVREEFENRARELEEENEERLSVLLEHSDSGFFDDHFQKGTCYLSPRWKEILGYADSELRNHFETFQSLLHPDELEKVLAAIAPQAPGPQPFCTEFRMRHKDGRWVWIESRGIVDADEQLKLKRHLGFIADITERRERGERLDLLELCFGKMDEGVLIIDAQFAPARLSILDANPAFERRSGYSRAELVGRDASFLKGPFQDALLLRRLFNEQKALSFEGESPRKDGSPLRACWTLSPLLDHDGLLAHLITSLRELPAGEAPAIWVHRPVG